MAVPKCFKQEFVDVAKLPQPIPGSPTPITKVYSDVLHLIRHDKTKEAKSMVRSQHWPVDHPNRGELWLQLCQQHSKGGGRHLAAGFYSRTVRETLGELWPMSLPAFADPIFCEDYLLSAEGQKRAERVLYVVSVSHPHITYCPLLHPVTSLLLHYLSEEQTYECVCSLIEGTAVRHLNQTRRMHDTSAYTLMQLTRRLAKKTYARLLRRVQQEEDLEKVFHTWELWIFRGLPLYHLQSSQFFPYEIPTLVATTIPEVQSSSAGDDQVRSVDCFLLEGVRALYRIAMAILILFTQEQSVEDPLGTADAGTFLDRIIMFCKQMPYTVDRFLKAAYSIQGFSAKVLNQQLLKSEMYIRSCSSGRLRAASEVGLQGSCPYLDVTSSCLPVRKRAHSLGIMPLANFHSEVLSTQQMALVWSWLPARITMLQPEVIYSTNEHGSSLTNFYFHTDTWEPTLLAILTTRDERFGAYCSTRWQERAHSSYFGTGETFLFTFVPQPRRFAWVGVGAAQGVPHTANLFISANQHMIQVGAGNGTGLYVDESLEHGRTEHCDTFDNSPLASSSDFVIRILEVIGFA